MIILLAGTLPAFAADSVDSTIKRLSTVERFAFGPVGYGGTTSEGEVDFKFLLSQRQPVALSAFAKVYATGNAQGRLYALAGIKRLNPKQFKELLASSKTSRQEVIVERGCIISHESFSEVAMRIDEGKFRF